MSSRLEILSEVVIGYQFHLQFYGIAIEKYKWSFSRYVVIMTLIAFKLRLLRLKFDNSSRKLLLLLWIMTFDPFLAIRHPEKTRKSKVFHSRGLSFQVLSFCECLVCVCVCACVRACMRVHACVCVWLFTTFLSILFVFSQEDHSLIASNQQIYDKWVIRVPAKN